MTKTSYQNQSTAAIERNQRSNPVNGNSIEEKDIWDDNDNGDDDKRWSGMGRPKSFPKPAENALAAPVVEKDFRKLKKRHINEDDDDDDLFNQEDNDGISVAVSTGRPKLSMIIDSDED